MTTVVTPMISMFMRRQMLELNHSLDMAESLQLLPLTLGYLLTLTLNHMNMLGLKHKLGLG